jgi:carbonic anhydrase
MKTVIPGSLAVLVWILSVADLQAGEPQAIPWGYEGNRGPTQWGKLGSEFALCGKGMAQSPIDLSRTHKITLDDIQFSYKDAPFHVMSNGHTLEEVEPLSETVKSRYPKHGETVLHFQKDSTIDQKHDPLELHLVHHNERHEAAVVAVFMKAGKHNSFFETFLAHAPQKVGEFIDDQTHMINQANLLPKHRSYYRYFGSHTTPPCHEGVIWAVLHDAIDVSPEQI